MMKTLAAGSGRWIGGLGAAIVWIAVSGCSDDGGGIPAGQGGTTTPTGGGGGGAPPGCPVGGGAGLPEPRPLGDLTGPWQLFIDDYLVDDLDGLTRRYHAFDKYEHNPVMVADQPWEDSYAYVYGRVMPAEDASGYRMWYSVLDFHDPNGASRVLYAESADGLHWTKPSLGIRDYGGSTDNNLFVPRNRPNHIMSVMHTPWDPDPDCAYQLINYDAPYESLPGGYFAACSPDGVHLTDVAPGPVIDVGEVNVGDVGHFLYDPWRQRYLGYVKVAKDVDGYRRRTVGLVTSTELADWPTTAPQPVLEPDAIDDAWASSAGLDLATHRTHFYGVSVFPYESMFLGFLWIFRAADPPGCGHDCEPYSGYIFGTIHVELVSSRDGVHFTREDGDLVEGRPPILELGPPGAWDSMMLFTANHPLLRGDRIDLYYGGCNEDHGAIGTDGSAAVGLATLRKDGFASLDAAGSTGSVTTKPLRHFEGPLRVNYAARDGGDVQVELLDVAGEVIPGYEAGRADALEGDEVDAIVTWGGSSALPSGPCELRVRFVLRDASLYSFAAGEQIELVP